MMNAKLNFLSKHKENRPFCASVLMRIRTIRRFLLLLAVVAAALSPGESRATETVEYLGYNGMSASKPATALESTGGDFSMNGWYYVSGTVTIGGNLTFSGACSIILCDGATLTVTGNINAAGGYSNTLYTYAQSNGSSMGKLRAGTISKAGHDNVIFNSIGGDIELAGFDGKQFGFYSGHFSAASINASYSCYLIPGQSTDWIKVGTYTVGTSLDLLCTMMVDDGPTTVGSGTVDASLINGKKLSVPPSSITPIGPVTGITNGTVVLNKSQVIANEGVTATFTPAAGYILADATVIDDGGTHAASASALSTGRWDFYVTRSASGGLSAFTVSATFATPVAQIGDTQYATLQAAFDAIANNQTIDILCDITEATASKTYTGDHNHTINLNGYNVTFDSHSAQGSLTINGPGTLTCKSLNNVSANGNQTLTINGATVVCNGVADDPPTTSIEWMADHIVLKGGADLTAKNVVFLGGGDGKFTFTIKDNASIAHLVNCKIRGYDDTNKAHIVQLRQYVSPNDWSYYDTQTSADEAVTVDLRASWGIMLASNLGEISPGVPKATVTFYDGGTSFDPPAFTPSTYTTSTTFIDNSDGNDHYVIAHIVPELFYWTDLSLLSAVETGTSLTGDANTITLLKRDQYDAANAGDPADMRDRYNGAGWYYYMLPKGHSVAAGYATSTIGGEVVPQFDLDNGNTVFSQDFDNNTLTISRTTDTWKATLTYDKLSWKFGGSFALSDLPKLQSISFKKGDTEKFLQNDANALAGQIENAYEIEQVRIGENLLKLRAILYGCFVQSDYFQSIYKVLVPFDGDGSSGNPWQINTAADLSLLAKCVNVGAYTFNGKTLAMGLNGKTYDMSGSDFEPIGTDSNLPFCGTLLGNGSTIKNISYVFAGPSAVSDETQYGIGFIGNLGDPGEPFRSGNVDNIKLENCSFSSSDGDIGYVGSIAGAANRGSVSNCYVIGGNVSAPKAGSYAGAIVGKLGNVMLTNNYYDYATTATLNGSTASGYTKRGICTETISADPSTTPSTYDWNDFTTNDGAVLWVQKATLPAATTSGSTVAFRQTTTPAIADATHPVDCYSISGTNYYYAVGQPITLSVTLGSSSPDGVRTFYDELSTLTMNDGTADTDIKDALGFTMPEADAIIAATFTPSDWFTINTVNYNATNPTAPFAYNWMTFYHEWESKNDPHDYVVSDGDGTGKTIEVKTVASVDPDKGAFTLADIDGKVSFSGVPTIFRYGDDSGGVLPQKLKFTPVDPTVNYTKPTVAPQFLGVIDAAGKTLTASDKCYVLNNAGDFILAYPTEGDDKIAAHKCYIDWNIGYNGNTPAPARLISSGDATGIDSMVNGQWSMDNLDGDWFSLDGRRLNGQPKRKGIYIHHGKKTVIK